MMQEIQIQPRDVYEHYVYVKHPGATLHWSFSTKKKNIHFGLFYRTGSPIAFVDHSINTSDNNTTTTNGNDLKSVSISNSLNSLTSDNNGNRKLSIAHGSSISHLRRKSLASLHLIEHDFQEIIPISHVNSSEEKIQGSYTVSEPGNCILIFDNTTSINTSKILKFQVTSDEPIQDSGTKEGDCDISGYLLKKRRKRMQGWCRRWFELSSKGLLSYSVNPNGIKRGSIQILMTMISIYPKQRTIHLDTGTTVYHLKALTKENFDNWVDVFRRQRALGQRNKDAGILVDGAWLLPDNRYRLTPNPTLQTRQQQQANNNNNKTDNEDENPLNIFVEEEEDDDDENEDEEGDDYFIRGSIKKDFKNLADELDVLQSEMNLFMKKQSSSLNNNNKSNLENANSHSSSRSSSFITTTPTTNSNNSSIKRKFPFRRGSSQPDQQLQHPLTPSQPSPTTATLTLHQNQLNELSSSTDTFIIQQSSLNQWIESIQRMIQIRDTIEKKYNQQEIDWMSRIKKPSYPYSSIYNQQGSEFGTPRTHSFYSYHSSNHSEMYFEAEEFELSHDEDDDADIVHEKNDDNDDDEDEDSSLEVPNNKETTTLSKSINDILQSPIPSLMKRRNILPHPVAGENVNILGVLRKNIGKDLSTITMPISLNEPLNLLQRLCEELEYSELLDQANHMDDSMDRLMYVAIFAITGYASSQYRIGRKFWNPLLFETYECIRPDKGFKFISEKVSHRPNVMACHAESDNFTFWQSTEGSTKFWGKSMEFISEGTIHVKLPKHKDHFVYTKPSSHMRNMILGQRYLEHVGQLKVTNKTTGDYAIVMFKEGRKSGGGGYFGGGQWERNEVEATFYSSNNKDQPKKKVVGKWSQSLSQELGDQQFKILWQVKPPTVENPMNYYGFTQFCMELNEITDIERDHLPPTDTRFRPDQHLFELGKVDEAEKEKDRVEVNQRERRSQNEAANIIPQPLWFQQNPNDPTEWEYKGGYFEARKTGEWPKEMITLW